MMKFERKEIGTIFSRLRAAVPEVRSSGNEGILLSGSDAIATNLELSVKAGLSESIDTEVVVPPRGVEFIGSTVAPTIEINIEDKLLHIKSGPARAKLSTIPASDYPEMPGPGNDAKHCIVKAQDLSWAISKVLYAASKDDRKPAHKGLCISRQGEDTMEICALDGYRLAVSRIPCQADGDFRFVLPAATAKAIDTLELDGDVEIIRDRFKAVIHDEKFIVTTRLIAEPFLEYTKIISGEYKGISCQVDRRELLGVLNRMKLAKSTDVKEKSILMMNFEPDGYGRASMRSTVAQMTEQFALEGDVPDPLCMGFNVDYLCETLKSMESDKVHIQLNGEISPAKFTEVGREEAYKAIVLPVKIRRGA